MEKQNIFYKEKEKYKNTDAHWSVVGTEYEDFLKKQLNLEYPKNLEYYHYYLFHTKYDVWRNGRIIVSPLAICTLYDTNVMEFCNSKNILVMPAVAYHPSKYVWDITNAVNECGIDKVNELIQKLRNEYYQ